jgi:hypothetical protein
VPNCRQPNLLMVADQQLLMPVAVRVTGVPC